MPNQIYNNLNWQQNINAENFYGGFPNGSFKLWWYSY